MLKISNLQAQSIDYLSCALCKGDEFMKRTIEDIQASCQRTLAAFKNTMGESSTVSVDPYNLSGQPCFAALEIKDEQHQLNDAPIFPLKGCISPEQCMCVYNVRKLAD